MNRFRERSIGCVALVAFGLSAVGSAARAQDAARVIERFTTDPDDDFLLLPVTLRGQKYLFALDIGTSSHLFDRSLRPFLGEPSGETSNVGTASGVPTSVELFPSPDARLGSLSLWSLWDVSCADLTRLREVSWCDLRGLIGMPSLGSCVVAVDPDSHTVAFLRSADKETDGTPLPLRFNDAGIPLVDVDLSGLGRRSFAVDTGARSSGSVRHEDFEALLKSGALRAVRTTSALDMSGRYRLREGRLDGLVLGKDRHDGLILSETSASVSRLGLGFLSRYVVTFDFPGRMMYLKKGRDFGRPDPVDLCGLGLLRKDGRVLVSVVDDDGAAARAGVHPFDLVTRVGDLDMAKARKSDVRRKLEAPGKTVRLTLRRGGKELDVDLRLDDPKKSSDVKPAKTGQ
jgi:hypothetical protein